MSSLILERRKSTGRNNMRRVESSPNNYTPTSPFRERSFASASSSNLFNSHALSIPTPPPVTNKRVEPTGLFRSETMSHLRLYFDRAAARVTVEELGHLGHFEFVDMNPGVSLFQRTYASDVKRCDEMMRRIKYLYGQFDSQLGLDRSVAIGKLAATNQKAEMRLDDLENHLASMERVLMNMNAHYDTLKLQLLQLKEMHAVMTEVVELFLDESRISLLEAQRRERRDMAGQRSRLGMGIRTRIGELLDPLIHPSSIVSLEYNGSDPPSDPIKLSQATGGTDMSFMSSSAYRRANGFTGESGVLSFSAGVIETSQIHLFERILFRSSRGNAFVRFSRTSRSIVDPVTGEPMNKTALVIFYSGEQMRQKVNKICQSLRANLYTIPEDPAQQEQTLQSCEDSIQEIESVLLNTEKQRKDILQDASMYIDTWSYQIAKETAIYHTMNLLNFDTSSKLFLAEGWCPSYALPDIQEALDRGRRKSNSQVSSIIEEQPINLSYEKPPTYYRLNKFTEIFHNIVEAYGVADYQEINPAPYAVITFPFLFAVMFGDVGHGILMALVGAFLILREKRYLANPSSLGEMQGMIFNGRYMIILMGIFSVYTGFLYNECFALPLDIFGSRWRYTTQSNMACGIDNCMNPASVLPPLDPYPVGFDPIWKYAQNGLIFFNSYKMKLSIILGVSQMMLGLFLSAANARFFRRPLDFFFEFVPQLVFLTSIFGYLVFLIILKWLINWNSEACLTDPYCRPPDLKAILIGMIMSPGSLPPQLKMFQGQAFVQKFLMGIAVISVPFMLLPKPLILRARHLNKNVKNRSSYQALSSKDDSQAFVLSENGDELAGNSVSLKPTEDQPSSHDTHGSSGFDFGEVFVNQMIHTIEFVLGAVSNTASYLRLWALSLAHAQLSDVFLEKLVLGPYHSHNYIGTAIGACMWLGATIGVICLMESLSAFLHALRLHWVEFQNKFYNLHGHSGRKFRPFSFFDLLVPKD